MNPFSDIGKNLAANNNVSFNVYDAKTRRLKRHYEGHNSVTHSMLLGIGHYLLGDGTLNHGWDMLRTWIPKYISLGTMGLRSQDCDDHGLPIDLGSIETSNPEEACKDYMRKVPGFGADGYDAAINNDRAWFGLGPQFSDRLNNGWFEQEFYGNGQSNGRPNAGRTDFPLEHKAYTGDADTMPVLYMNNEEHPKIFGTDYWFNDEVSPDYSVLVLSESLSLLSSDTLRIKYFDNNPLLTKSVDCELISPSFPRVPISYRAIIPEVRAELPKTIDIVFSAMISTGALKQFRGYSTIGTQTVRNDYIFITEAGLWSSKEYGTRENSTTGEKIPSGSGLLAGYRIAPPNEINWDMTKEENRKLLQQSILRVGYNEVVQVVWKLQLGSISDLGNNMESSIIAQANQILEDGINGTPS